MPDQLPASGQELACTCGREDFCTPWCGEDQHALSIGQMEFENTDLVEHWRQTSPRLLAIVESLRQQLAAAQAELDSRREESNVLAIEHNAAILRESHLRAQIEELRQRASDYEIAEGTAIVQRNAALNEALKYKHQAEAMRGVVEAARCIHARHAYGCLSSLMEGSDDQCTCGYREFRKALAALDATSDGQPATPSNRPHPAPPANDSPTQARPEVRNAGPSELHSGRHPEAPGE